MIGAILGDMVGSPYEFDAGSKSKDFPLFCEKSTFTDDTVMTLAVAKAFMDVAPDADDDTIRASLVRSMHELAQRYTRWLSPNGTLALIPRNGGSHSADSWPSRARIFSYLK